MKLVHPGIASANARLSFGLTSSYSDGKAHLSCKSKGSL